MIGGTVTIDDPANGGGDAGAWLTAIAHTPALRAQCPEDFPARVPSGRTEIARDTDGRPGAIGAGETVASSPTASAPVSPASLSQGDGDA
jgi:hypothetical protein